LEVIINIEEIERRVKVFVDYCDFIQEDCEDELEEELLEFVNDLLTDIIVKNSALRKKLDEV